jgi:hypothetical protein
VLTTSNSELFPCLRGALRPGGLLLFSTFLDDGAVDHGPELKLRVGELAQEFGPTVGFDVLVDEQAKAEGSRQIAVFAARRQPRTA